MQCGVVGANDGGGHHNKKMAHCGDSSADISAYDIEFRSSVDDAWYSVRLLLDNDTLVVKFWAFPEGSDERYIADDFQTLEAIDEFVRRFRPVSLQLQDDQCSNVTEGTIVTACFAFKDDDVRFYDAMIEAVHKEKHSFAEGEEECLCSFVLFWQHGPNKGTLTYANVANICQIQTAAQLDSRVASFLKMAKVKSGNCSVVPASVYEGDMSLSLGDMCGKENCGSSIKLEPSIFLHGLQETIGSRQYVSAVKTSEGKFDKFPEKIDQDKDLGGETFSINAVKENGSHYFIFIENLEKDLPPSSIVEFIHSHTSISPQVHVIPSLLSESYARCAIALDCKEKLKKIHEFLSNPDHIIISLRGRPWILTENLLRRGTFKMALGSLMPKSHYKFQEGNIGDELKVVHFGDEEYQTAKRRRDLVRDFVDHQRRLHKRLALEDGKILQSSTQCS